VKRLVPDIAQGDVYICGPEGFTERAIDVALRLGVNRKRIHHEAFSF